MGILNQQQRGIATSTSLSKTTLITRISAILIPKRPRKKFRNNNNPINTHQHQQKRNSEKNFHAKKKPTTLP